MNNLISLIGYVGEDPTSVSIPDTANKVVKFSVGVIDYFSKSDKKETMWVDVDAWNGLGERVLNIVTKGREVSITGRLGIAKYHKEINGVKVPVTKPIVKLTGFHVCGPKPNGDIESTPKRGREPKEA